MMPMNSRAPRARRDCEPHRGWFLCILCWVGFFSSILAASLIAVAQSNVSLPPGANSLFVLTFITLDVFGLALGLSAWLMARRDLAKMGAGSMDPHGFGPTALASSVGRAA